MRQLFDRAVRSRRNVNPFPTARSERDLGYALGRRDMKERLLEQLVVWATTCPRPETADDLWDFVRKIKEGEIDV